MRQRISQKRAYALRKRVNELEQKIREMKRSWGREWPDGVDLLSLQKQEVIAEEEIAIIRTARKLGHPVIVTEQGNTLHFYGVTV